MQGGPSDASQILARPPRASANSGCAGHCRHDARRLWGGRAGSSRNGGHRRDVGCGDRGQRGHELEPDRDDHAGRVPTGGERSTASHPGQHGDGPGRRLRRGQRDRAERIGRISSRRVSPRLPRRRPPRQPRRTACSRASSRRCRRAFRSRTGRACCRRWTTEYAASLAAIPDRPSKTQGIAAGNAAADAMIAARKATDASGHHRGCRTMSLGHWQPQLEPGWDADARPDPVGRATCDRS